MLFESKLCYDVGNMHFDAFFQYGEAVSNLQRRVVETALFDFLFLHQCQRLAQECFFVRSRSRQRYVACVVQDNLIQVFVKARLVRSRMVASWAINIQHRI